MQGPTLNLNCIETKSDILGTVKPQILKTFKEAEFLRISEFWGALPPASPLWALHWARWGLTAPQTPSSTFVPTQ